MGDKRNAGTIFVGKPGGRIPLGRHRRKWDRNTKMILKKQVVRW